VVRAKPRPGPVRIREVEVTGREELLALAVAEQRHQQPLELLRGERAFALRHELAAHAEHRRIVRRQVQVGGTGVEQAVEQLSDHSRFPTRPSGRVWSWPLASPGAYWRATSSSILPAASSSPTESSKRIIPNARPRCIRFGSW